MSPGLFSFQDDSTLNDSVCDPKAHLATSDSIIGKQAGLEPEGRQCSTFRLVFWVCHSGHNVKAGFEGNEKGEEVTEGSFLPGER